jgi:hypothetical protein
MGIREAKYRENLDKLIQHLEHGGKQLESDGENLYVSSGNYRATVCRVDDLSQEKQQLYADKDQK